MQRNRGKQLNGKDWRSLQENERYQGNISEKMGSIKDRNGMDLTEVKMLRRAGKNTQKNYTKKIFMTQITMMV